MTCALKLTIEPSALTQPSQPPKIGEIIMLKVAYHTQKSLEKQQFRPQNRLSLVPVSILAIAILIGAIFQWLINGGAL